MIVKMKSSRSFGRSSKTSKCSRSKRKKRRRKRRKIKSKTKMTMNSRKFIKLSNSLDSIQSNKNNTQQQIKPGWIYSKSTSLNLTTRNSSEDIFGVGNPKKKRVILNRPKNSRRCTSILRN